MKTSCMVALIVICCAATGYAQPEQVTQQIELRAGWNLFSANVTPSDDYVEDGVISIRRILDPIIDDVIIVRNEAGRFIVPNRGYWGFTEWIPSQAYMIRVRQAVTIEVTGEPIAFDTPLQLHAGWNFTAYYPDYDLPLRHAFVNLIETGHARIIKDGYGHYISPRIRTYPYTSEPGYGYQINVDEACEFRYPARQ